MRLRAKITIFLAVYLSAVNLGFALDKFDWEDIYTGVKYLFYSTNIGGPVKFYAVSIDLKQSRAKIVVSSPEDRGKKPSEFAKDIGAQIAVNGSDWKFGGRIPYGLTVSEGKIWPGTADDDRHGFFAVNKNSEVWISSQGKNIDLSSSKIFTAISGRPVIVRGGKLGEVSDCGYACLSHPRTAVGIDKSGNKVFLAVVDGRQKDSVSITLKSLAEFMLDIGVWDALNLDGGGSSVLYIKDKGGVVNNPSDGRERPVSNSLAVIVDSKPLSEESYEKEYSRLIQTYKECLVLENEAFNRLTFKLSGSQLIKNGVCPKLTLEDNLGGKWIFKPSYSGRSDAAVIVYRIFKLFGLPCPEIHPITLNINGKKVYGGIQRFISNEGTLAQVSPERLSSKSLDYLLSTHVFYWLLDNNDAGYSNFIVLSFDKDGNAEDVLRVDNEIAFIYLDTNNISNFHNKSKGTYYNLLWDAYESGKIDPDFKKPYAFTKFVENFPDSLVIKLIHPLIHQDTKELSNPDFSVLNEKVEDFLKDLILKKSNLSKDFAEFYRDLAAKKQSHIILPQNIDYRKNILQTTEALSKRIDEIKKEADSCAYSLNKKNAVSAVQSEIQAVFSFEGFKLLNDIYKNYWVDNGKDSAVKCDYALLELLQLESSARNKYEREALKLYMKEIKKIRSGNRPSFRYNYINKVVDP